MNARDEKFAEEYLFDYDAKNAALRAGFAYSTARNAAAWINPENPTKPALRKRIDQLIAEQSKRTGITADRVLLEIARVAFADISDVLDVDKLCIREGLPRDRTAAVASVTIGKGKNPKIEVRMADKMKAIELIGRRLGLFDGKAAGDADMESMLAQIAKAVGEIG